MKSKLSSLVYAVVAVVLGLVGQSQLARNIFSDAAVFYAAAAILIVYALRQQAKLVAPDRPAQEARLGAKGHRGLTVGALSGLLAVLALRQFSSGSPSASGWLLYLGSLAVFVAAAFLLDSFRSNSFSRSPTTEAVTTDAKWSRIDLGLLLLILAIAAFMRLYHFDQFPIGTWYDEAENGLYARQMLADPQFRPMYVESTNLPAHYLYLVALSFHLLGSTTQAIRAVSVVMGLLTIVAAYLAGRELLGRRAGWVLAFLLAVSRWDVNWSRIGMHGVSTPLFELLTIAFLLRALRRGRFADFAWAGLALGLGLDFYSPFRVFPLVIALFLLHRTVVERGFLRRSGAGLIVLGLAALLTIAPVVQYAIRHPAEFWNRTRMTSVFAGKTSQQGWQAVKENTLKHVLMFNYRGDPNGRHNLAHEPMLDPASGVLMVLGIGLCLWRGKRPRYLLAPVWLGVMLLPAIFSLDFEAPQSLRAIGSLPAACLLVTVTLDELWQEWDRVMEPRRTLYFVAPLLLVLGQIGYANYYTYFERQAKNFDSWAAFSTAETIVGRTMAELGDRAEFYVINFYYETPTLRFLAPNITRYHRLETTDSLPLELKADKSAVLFLDPERESLYAQAEQYYPRATFKEYKPPFGGPPALYAIYLSPSDIASIQGLMANYYSQADWTGQPTLTRQEASLRFDWRDGDPLPLPFSVEWQGVLRVSDYGSHRFILQSPARAELYLDETPVVQGEGEQSAEMTLARGNHAMRLRAAGAPGHFELAWQPPNEAQTLLPSWALYTPPVTSRGLLGKYYRNGNWQPPVAFAQIDPWINFYFHVIPLPRPYTIEWEGKIAIPRSGRYGFSLDSRDESLLYIEGQLAAANPASAGSPPETLDLQEGLHDVQLRFADRTRYTHVTLYWTPPGESRQVVPTEALLPPQGNYRAPTVAAPGAEPGAPITAALSTTLGIEPTPTPVQPARKVAAELLWQVGSCGSGPQEFQSPHGVAVDRQGNVYVADTGNHRVVKLSPEGQPLLAFGQEGDQDGAFLAPFDLVVDADGNIVVLDSEAKRVLQRFTAGGSFQASLGTNWDVYHPRGLGIDATGDLYVADTGNLRLLHLSPDGAILDKWGGSGKIGAGQPVDSAAAPDGTIYLIEAERGLMWRLAPDGDTTSWVAVMSADTMDGPHVAVGADSLVYVTDPEGGRIVVYNSSGQPVAQFGQRGSEPGQFAKPVGIAVGAGRVYVSDSPACRVRAFKLVLP